MSVPGKSILSFLNPLFEPIVVIDRQKKPVYWNHYFCTYTKCSPRVLKDLVKVDSIFSCEELSIGEFLEDSMSIPETNYTKELSVSLIQHPEVRYTVVIKLVPLPDSQFFMLCINDLTVERQIHNKYRQKLQELKESHQQVVQSDKLTSLGQLTASISHEISNPLTIATGSNEMLEVLLEKENINPDHGLFVEKVKDIRDSLDRIQKIMSNMKFFLHQSGDGKVYHDLAEIIEGAISMVNPAFQSNEVALEVEIKTKNSVALVNPTKIEQVIINLLKNALDAVMSSMNTDKQVGVFLDYRKDTDQFIIQVEDNGVGMDLENQSKIFDPFYTTKSIGEGTGLGLSISHKIIREHEGDLTVDSEFNDGSTFTVVIPGVENASFAEHSERWNEGKEGSGIKILAVDDDPDILNILKEFLIDENYIFIGSTRPEEALDFLNKMKIDLIITDFNMPEMNGSDFISRVRSKNSQAPIAYLTTKDYMQQYQRDKMKYNISGIILKPFTKNDVLKVIRESLLNQAA